MEENTNMPQHTPLAAPTAGRSNGAGFMQRQMHGTAFLSLEHFIHMVLVVLVPMFIAGGITMLISMWRDDNSLSGISSYSFTPFADPMLAIWVFGSLAVLLPLMLILGMRVQAEVAKRDDYTKRLAYRFPLYGAMALLIATIIPAFIGMLITVVSSLALIGVKDAGIADMYLNEFLPALITFVVSGLALVYLAKMAKGQRGGQKLALLIAVIGAIVAVALLVTAVIELRNPKPVQNTPSAPSFDLDQLEDSFNSSPSDLPSLDEYYR